MDTKISDLPAAASVADADVVPLVQAGTTKKSAFSAIWTYVLGKINAGLASLHVTGSATIDGDVYGGNAVYATYVEADTSIWTDGDLHAGGDASLGSMGLDNTHTVHGTLEIEPGNTFPGDLGVTGTAWVDDHVELGGSTTAATGLIRAPNNAVLLAALNAAGTGDIAAVSITSGNALWIGNQSSGIGNQATSAFLNGSTSAALAAGGSARVSASTSTIGHALPVIGLNTPYGAIDGVGTQAMADADQTTSNVVHGFASIECTGALTATRTLTLPTPASTTGIFRRPVLNRCSGGSIQVKTATGTATVTIAAGMSAIVEVRNGTVGVARITPDVAHGL